MHRLRIFAGPNGSGKSTLYKQLQGQLNLGCYLNPDELHKQVENTSMLELQEYGVTASHAAWETFWNGHGLKEQAPRLNDSYIKNNVLVFKEKPRSYESSILSDFLRHQILKTGQTFSFETVFSHSSKLDFMRKANEDGYRCYLYFAALNSPELSVSRVRQRTMEGGHDVPEEKIRSRYFRTLENLKTALNLSHRAFLFDNSSEMTLIAEKDPEGNLDLKGTSCPSWLSEYVLS